MRNSPDAFVKSPTYRYIDDISLRDWFAGMALQSYYTACDPRIERINKAQLKCLAETAYQFADAMLEARDKK